MKNDGLLLRDACPQIPTFTFDASSFKMAETLFVRLERNAGSSSRREPDDDGVLVLLGGVTPAQGAEKSSAQGEGAQVVNLLNRGLAGREMHKS